MHFWKLTAREAEAGPQVQDHLGLHVCDVGMVRVHVMYVMCMSHVVVCVREEVYGYDVGVAYVHKGELGVCGICV